MFKKKGTGLLFVSTIVLCVAAIISIVSFILSFSAIQALYEDPTYLPEYVGQNRIAFFSGVRVAIIVLLVISLIIYFLAIYPGFRYSISGKCGTWARVMGVILFIFGIADIISTALPGGVQLSGGAIAIEWIEAVVSLVFGACYCAGAFMLGKQD